MNIPVKKVAVLGAGNGGLSAAADLSDKGFEVALYDLPEFEDNIHIIRKNGGIRLIEPEKKDKLVPISLVTTNLEEAIKDAQIIMLTIPGYAIETFCTRLVPIALETQLIFFNGAAAMGCLRLKHIANKLGIKKNFFVAETNSLTYGTRSIPSQGISEIWLRAKKIYVSAYPASRTTKALELLNQIYDCFVPAVNILETTFENGNPEVHPGPSLLNVGRIDYAKGDFYLYKEGMTEHTIKVMNAVHKEKNTIAKEYGLIMEDAFTARKNRGYFGNSTETNLLKAFNTSPIYTAAKGPATVNSRYFIEDLSDGLVLWRDLGRIAKINTPAIDAIITLGSIILDINYFEEGLTLKKIGLNINSKDELLSVL